MIQYAEFECSKRLFSMLLLIGEFSLTKHLSLSFCQSSIQVRYDCFINDCGTRYAGNRFPRSLRGRPIIVRFDFFLSQNGLVVRKTGRASGVSPHRINISNRTSNSKLCSLKQRSVNQNFHPQSLAFLHLKDQRFLSGTEILNLNLNEKFIFVYRYIHTCLFENKALK